MPRIMADNDVRGQFEKLLEIFASDRWKGVWVGLDVTVETFANLGLAADAPDTLVWQTCQAKGVVLFTGNRNQEGPGSLETAIRTQNQLDSLPVITLSRPKRFSQDRGYAEEVAEAVLDILMDLESRRGAGRLFVP